MITLISAHWPRRGRRPARRGIAFGGDFGSCVVWAVSPAGTVANLGGIANLSDKGTASYSFPKRSFAIMITAEPIVTVRNPSDIVVFTSGTPADKNVQPSAFTFNGLESRQGLVKRGIDSIAGSTFC